MNQKTKTILFWTVLAFLAVIFILSKYWTPAALEAALHAKNFDFLNMLAGSSGEQLWEFYSVQIEERLFGPIAMLASGAFFLLLSVRCLQKVNGWIFALSVFIYLVVTRFEVLLFPPYGDTVVTSFAEAIWLARHSFDYNGLAQQPNFHGGGPNVYLLTIYPTFLAALIKILPTVKSFLIVNHLIAFGLGAGIISVFRNILLKIYEQKIALLISIVMLSFPLFQSMVEAISMTVPVVFFSVLALYYLVEKNFKNASIMSMIAVMIKGYAVYMSLTIFIVSVLLYVKERKLSTLLWGAGALAFVIIKSFLPFWLFKVTADIERIGLFQGVPSLLGMAVFYLFLISLGVFLWQSFKDRKNDYLKNYYIPMVLFLTALVWFVIFMNSYAVAPRYRLSLAPITLFCIYYAAQFFIKKTKYLSWILVSVILFSFFCSYGLLYPQLSDRRHVMLERSLEYRNDLKLNVRLAKIVEESFYPFKIAAPFVIAQILRLPELGYVEKERDVMIYGMKCTYGGITNFTRLNDVNLKQTLWIGEEVGRPNYPVGPHDILLLTLHSGIRKVYLFKGGVEIERYRVMSNIYFKNKKTKK